MMKYFLNICVLADAEGREDGVHLQQELVYSNPEQALFLTVQLDSISFLV